MNLLDAAKSRGREQPFLTREKWVDGYIFEQHAICPIKLLPTDSPDGILVHSLNDGEAHRSWTPTLDDITAEDWFPTA